MVRLVRARPEVERYDLISVAHLLAQFWYVLERHDLRFLVARLKARVVLGGAENGPEAKTATPRRSRRIKGRRLGVS
jgi:hypothetical protein